MTWSRRASIACLTVTALVLWAAPSRADDDADRDTRTGQLIWNGIQMSSTAGAPTAAIVAKYRRAGSSSTGVGYRTQQLVREQGVRLNCMPGAVYLNEKGLAMTLDQTAKGVLADRLTSDRRTGATVYIRRDDQGKADSILYLVRRGNVQLYMFIKRSDEDAETMTRKSINRWRFYVSEAERLGIFGKSNPPRLIVKVWDERLGDWQVLENGKAFARRLAKLGKEETLILEVEAASDVMAGDQPYELEMRVTKGDRFLKLRDADGRTPLADPDRDGWNEVRVEPVDGRHPPRRLTACFAAEPQGSSLRTQKGQIGVRYADESGVAEAVNGMERGIPDIIITHFELRAMQLSAQFHAFVGGRMPRTAAQQFVASREEPGLWFNGTYDEHRELQSNWAGAFAPGEFGDLLPGFSYRVTVPGHSPAVGSQSAALGALGTPCLGWARDLRPPGQAFLVQEDRPGQPLEIGPFLRPEAVSLYIDLSIMDEMDESSEASGGGMGAIERGMQEKERDLRESLEIGMGEEQGCPLEVSVWLVDDLKDLKDASGGIPNFSAKHFPRIKQGLRKPTVKRLTDRRGKPFNLYAWRPGDSRDINTFFPMSFATLGQPVAFGPEGDKVTGLRMDLETGIYELQLSLVLRDRVVEEGEDYALTWPTRVALRFWVLDLPGTDERQVIQGIDTERVPPPTPPRGREFRHESPGAALLDAAKTGDAATLASAIDAGADVNAVDEHGASPLGWATSNGHQDAVRLLLKKGANVHFQTARGQSALNVAASRDDRAMVRLLLQAGADANERIKGESAPEHLKGATPIFLAARQGEGGALGELVRAGADVDAANAMGATVLLVSAEDGEAQVLRRLLQLGADPKRTDPRGVTPLMAAAHGGSAECVWLLIDKGADPNRATSTMSPGPFAGLTALMAAAQGGHESSTLALLLSGAKPNAKNFDGKTALDMARAGGNKSVMELLKSPRTAKSRAAAVFLGEIKDAVEEGRMDFVKMMVSHGVDLNAPNENGLPLLVYAADRGEADTVKGLIAAGADVNVRDAEYGATALMEAAMEGRDKIVHMLIEAGADVNLGARGDPKGEAAGWTALMGAAAAGRAEIVRALLDAGADPSIVNAQGETALVLAREAKQGNKARVIQLLSRSGKD